MALPRGMDATDDGIQSACSIIAKNGAFHITNSLVYSPGVSWIGFLLRTADSAFHILQTYSWASGLAEVLSRFAKLIDGQEGCEMLTIGCGWLDALEVRRPAGMDFLTHRRKSTSETAARRSAREGRLAFGRSLGGLGMMNAVKRVDSIMTPGCANLYLGWGFPIHHIHWAAAKSSSAKTL